MCPSPLKSCGMFHAIDRTAPAVMIANIRAIMNLSSLCRKKIIGYIRSRITALAISGWYCSPSKAAEVQTSQNVVPIAAIENVSFERPAADLALIIL